MESKIIQNFKGIINDVEFDNERQYKAIEFLIENIEDKFGKLSDEFTKDLKSCSEEAQLKYDIFSYSIFEDSVMKSLNTANSIQELVINYENSNRNFEEINEKLENGNYLSLVKEKIDNLSTSFNDLLEDKDNSWIKKLDNDKSNDFER